VENEYLRMDYEEEEEEEETPAEEETEESAPIETEETDPVAPVIDYEAEAEEVTAETVVQKILDSVEVP
jgi:hypothetical protein